MAEGNERKKVLIVDDNEKYVTHLKSFINRTRLFAVSTAADGAQGVEQADKVRPDIMILDIDLPVMNGFEVLEELTRREIETRIVMISGMHTDNDTIVRCIRAGACDYIAKPTTGEELLKRLRRHCLVDTSINSRVIYSATSIDSLIDERKRLERKVRRLSDENESLKLQTKLSGFLVKAVDLLLPAIPAAMMFKWWGISAEWAVGAYLLLVFITALGVERLRRITAAHPDLGSIDLSADDPDERDEKPPESPATAS